MNLETYEHSKFFKTIVVMGIGNSIISYFPSINNIGFFTKYY